MTHAAGNWRTVGEWMRSTETNDRSDSTIEVCTREQLERRGTSPLAKGTDSYGGYVVGDAPMAALDVALKRICPLLRYCTIHEGPTGADLRIPTIDDVANVSAIVAENTQRDPMEQLVFNQTVLGSYAFTSGMCRVSHELLNDTDQLSSRTLFTLLGERLARGLEPYLISGTGTGQPAGVLHSATDSSITAASATVVTVAELLSLEAKLDPQYRMSSSCVWLMNPSLWSSTKAAIVANTSWLVQLKAANGMDTLCGHPVIETHSMETGATKKSVVILDASRFHVRQVTPVWARRLVETYAELGQTAFSLVGRFGSHMTHATAAYYLTQHS